MLLIFLLEMFDTLLICFKLNLGRGKGIVQIRLVVDRVDQFIAECSNLIV